MCDQKFSGCLRYKALTNRVVLNFVNQLLSSEKGFLQM